MTEYFSDNNLFVLWRSVLHRGTHPILSRWNVAVVGDSAARIAWVGLQLHLLGHLLPLLLHHLLHRLKPDLPQLDSLVGVSHAGVLHHGPEHHEETDKEVYVDGLHVGDLGQGGVDRVDEGGHGEHSGHPQPHPGGGRPSVEPE